MQLVVVLFTLFLTGGYAALRDEIEAANERFTEAFDRQDASTLAGFYTEDCTLMATGSDVVQGRESVRKLLDSIFKMGVGSVVLKIDEVGPCDATDTLYERSHYTFFDVQGNIIDKGKHVVVWKKVAGQWHLHLDIFNSNVNPAQPTTLKDQLTAANDEYSKEWAEQDAEGVGAFYTWDAKIMASGMDNIHGREAITVFIGQLFEMGVANIRLDTQEVMAMGTTEDSAYERGYYFLTASDGGVIDHGKYVYLWKRVDGEWKIYVDIFNTNSSPPQEEAHDEL